jgi:hypothetical protein
MVMKFFTRAFPESDWESVSALYWEYVRALDLPSPVAGLAHTSFHDGRPLDWALAGDNETVRLTACIGDLQRGYWIAEVAYDGAALLGATAEEVAGWLAEDGAELLYTEVDRQDGEFVHRHLMAPAGEFAVQFQDVRLTLISAPSRITRERRTT